MTYGKCELNEGKSNSNLICVDNQKKNKFLDINLLYYNDKKVLTKSEALKKLTKDEVQM